MRDHLSARLRSLKQEFGNGERMLADLDARRGELRDSLLRISGAILVLEEELKAMDEGAAEEKKPAIAAVAEAAA